MKVKNQLFVTLYVVQLTKNDYENNTHWIRIRRFKTGCWGRGGNYVLFAKVRGVPEMPIIFYNYSKLIHFLNTLHYVLQIVSFTFILEYLSIFFN